MASDPDRVQPGKGPNPIPPRSYASPEDVYEDQTGWDSPFAMHAPGIFRPMWAVPDNSVSNSPVSSSTSSGHATTNLSNQVQGGMVSGPMAQSSSSFAPVPNMQIPLQTSGPVQLNANLSLKSTSASDAVQLAFYRDGNLIGSAFTGTSPAATSSAFVINMSAVDNPTMGNHVYAVYWKAGSGTLTANGTQRNFYALNLRPS